MKKVAASIFVGLACSIAQAQQAPVVGVWEQLPVGGGQDGQNAARHDVVLVDRKLADDTVFSALTDAGKQNSVLCCIKVSRNASITLADLLKKYPWDDDIAAHLKSIMGWKYIYEAKLVDASAQNAGMRELVKNLSLPPALSPYSAAIISGKIGSDQVPATFSTGGASVSFSTRPMHGNNAIQYKFSVNGTAMKFTEAVFAD